MLKATLIRLGDYRKDVIKVVNIAATASVLYMLGPQHAGVKNLGRFSP